MSVLKMAAGQPYTIKMSNFAAEDKPNLLKRTQDGKKGIFIQFCTRFYIELNTPSSNIPITFVVHVAKFRITAHMHNGLF